MQTGFKSEGRMRSAECGMKTPVGLVREHSERNPTNQSGVHLPAYAVQAGSAVSYFLRESI